MKLKAIIVDDEYSARAILAKLIDRFCPDVELVEICEDIESAVEMINIHKPDLVFLDVEMPRFSGYEIVNFFDSIDFSIIFITAYDKYAIKAFQVSAIDYLLKPLEIERLKAAIEKVKRSVIAKSYKDKLVLLSEDIKKASQRYSYTDKGFTNFANVDDIVAYEAQRSYTIMHLIDGKKIVISRNIKSIEEEIASYENLRRIHRSWIVNKNHILKYAKSSQEIYLSNNLIARVSRQNKSLVDSFFG